MKGKEFEEIICDVAHFQEVFKVGNSSSPTLITEEESVFRYNLMKEENEEYLDAVEAHDLVEIADAIGDQLYVLCGTILRHGLQDKMIEVFNEIHRSNMSKLSPEGEPIFRETDNKVMKGPNYFRPNIAEILK